MSIKYEIGSGHKKIAVSLIENGSNVCFDFGEGKRAVFHCVLECSKKRKYKIKTLTDLCSNLSSRNSEKKSTYRYTE